MRRRAPNTLGLGGPEPLSRPRPRAPRPLLTAVVALALAGFVIAWMRYDPIEEPGPAAPCPEAAAEVPAADFSDADAEQFPDRSAICVLRNINTTRATLGTYIANSGPVGVRLTGVRVASVPGVFEIEELALAPADAPLDRERAEPVDGSVRLPGGSARLLALTVSLPDCATVGRPRVVTLPELPLRARVLGLPRDVDLRLDPVVRLQAEFCP
jgi:hypothetical protein